MFFSGEQFTFSSAYLGILETDFFCYPETVFLELDMSFLFDVSFEDSLESLSIGLLLADVRLLVNSFLTFEDFYAFFDKSGTIFC